MDLTKREVRQLFHAAVEEQKLPPRQRCYFVEMPDSPLGFPVDQVCKEVMTDSSPISAEDAATLGLPPGATYNEAAVFLLREYDKPEPPMTPEEEAEEEMELLELSAAIETINEAEGREVVPVLYPKANRNQ